MEPNALFQVINLAAMIAWLLLIIIPTAKITRTLVHSGVIFLFLAGLYAALIVSFFDASRMQDFSTLEGVMSLFTDPMGVVAGWAHYLAFDLFIGMWITADGAKNGINRWLLLPCQILTFMFGPMGFLCYYGVRFFTMKGLPPRLLDD